MRESGRWAGNSPPTPHSATPTSLPGDTSHEESRLKQEMVLASISQLQQWAEALPVRRRPVRVRLALPALTDKECASSQQRLERLHNDCGCSAAAAAFLGAILSIAGYAYLVGFEQASWLIAIKSVLAAIAALFVGKWFGHFRSRMKLRADLLHLIHTIEQRTVDESRN